MSTPPGSALAVEAAGLTKRFRGGPALDAFDLALPHGTSLALFGPNGAGKTTLLRLLALTLRPDSGTLSIDGLDPRREGRSVRSRIGLVSHPSFLYDSLTAQENLELFARLHGVPEPRSRALFLLDSLGLAHRAADPLRSLSRGMQQRVSLARALVHDPPILLLDEPFTALDREATECLQATIEGLRARRRTVLIATHDVRQGRQLSDRWISLSRGRIDASGVSATEGP